MGFETSNSIAAILCRFVPQTTSTF